MSMSLDNSTGTAYLAYRQNGYPSNQGMLSTVRTGTVLASDGIASSGETANSVGMGPHVRFSGTTMQVPYLNGTDGASPGFIEMATRRAEGTEISTVDGESYSVGSYGISMALDSEGNQHIAYYNSSDASLMYAKYDGASWQIEEVDDSGTTGRYASIAIDSDDLPHISYVHDTSPDEVRYAHYNGTGWSIETVDTPYYAYDTSITLDSSGDAHISYAVYNSSGNSYNLRYSYHNGTEWVYEDIKDYRSSYWYSHSYTGYSSQIKLNSTDAPHIVFFDDYYDDVYISIRTDGTWSSTSVDGNGGLLSLIHI